MKTLLLLAALVATPAFADGFGEGDYSTDGTGPCYTGTACQNEYPWNQNPQPLGSGTWDQCIKHSGPVSWMNSHGKCLYRDPRGD